MSNKFLLSTLVFGTFLLMGQGCTLGGSQDPVTTGPAGVFTSEDAGETWKKTSLFPTLEGVKTLDTVSVYKLVDDPTDADTFYWGSRGKGLFYTTDGAKSWSRAAAPLDDGFIYSISVHPQDHCTLYVTTGKNVYRTTDCLRSWSQVYREAGTDIVRSLAINPFGSFEVFMLKEKGDILKSEDAGVSWQVITRMKKTTLVSLLLDSNTAGRMYVGTKTKGLFRSDNGGDTWTDLNKPLRKFPGALEYRNFSVYPTKKNVLYWISTYGILRSEDAGESWTPFELITSPGSGRIYGFAIKKKNEKEMYYTTTVGVRSTFYKTIDGGENWITKRLPSGQIPTAIRLHPEKESVVYLGFTIPPKK